MNRQTVYKRMDQSIMTAYVLWLVWEVVSETNKAHRRNMEVRARFDAYRANHDVMIGRCK